MNVHGDTGADMGHSAKRQLSAVNELYIQDGGGTTLMSGWVQETSRTHGMIDWFT